MGRISRGSLVGLILCMVWCAVVGNWLMINGKLMMIMLDSEDGINKQKRAGMFKFHPCDNSICWIDKDFFTGIQSVFLSCLHPIDRKSVV